jgi:hypothetical protein
MKTFILENATRNPKKYEKLEVNVTPGSSLCGVNLLGTNIKGHETKTKQGTLLSFLMLYRRVW